jgi:hypothetical protein
MTTATHMSVRFLDVGRRRSRTGGPAGSTPASVQHTPVDTSGSVDLYLRCALEQFAEVFDARPISRTTDESPQGSGFNQYLESSIFSSDILVDEVQGVVASTPTDDVVAVIRKLENELGLPLKDVLAAAGIKKRTFHSWDSGAARAPQLRSQGQLWQLVDAVEDVRESVGGPVGPWLKSDLRRMSLLRSGLLDDLVDVSLPARTAQDDRAVRRGIAHDLEMPVIRQGDVNVSTIRSGD